MIIQNIFDRHTEVESIESIINGPYSNKISKIIEAGIHAATIAQLNEEAAMYGTSSGTLEMTYDCLAAELKFNLAVGRPLLAKVQLRVKAILLLAGRPDNPTVCAFLEKMIADTPALWQLAYLSPRELDPEFNKPYDTMLALKREQRVHIKTSSLYLCQCGERKTMRYEIQTRSLDEPGTLYIQCIPCGRSWAG